MAILTKIDSNLTGLSYAKETSIGVLPMDPTWYPLEPNSYSNFGGKIALVARMPINASRQRNKGVVTDLTVGGTLNSDLTYPNMQDLLQGYFFANLRKKLETSATAVANASSVYSVPSTDGLVTGALALATGFTNSGNNGLVNVVSFITDTSFDVSQTLTDEASPPVGNAIVIVGQQFGSGDLQVEVPGDLPELVSTAVAATGVLTISMGPPDDGDQVDIGGQTYTFKTALTPLANEVLIGGSLVNAALHLIEAINDGPNAGTDYAASTVANAFVTAVTGGSGVVDVTAIFAGVDGNTIVTTAPTNASTNLSWGGATLQSGSGTGFLELGLIPGEWIWIGGDATNTTFATAADVGWARVQSITDTVLVLDKTQETFTADNGAGMTVQLFFGRVLKNENDPSLIVRQTYQLERTLGYPDTSMPTSPQAEYLVGCVPNTFKINLKTGAKLEVDLDFVGINNYRVTQAEGLLAGERVALLNQDAFNTTSDFGRLKLAILDPTTSNPSALFGFVTDMMITIDNKLTPDKAVAVLGAFEVTEGFFNVDITATAYFSEVTAIDAIRNNSDVTIDFALVKANIVGGLVINQGIVLDAPLVALSDGLLNVVINKPIDLPLTIPASRDRVFDHTLLMDFFDYLPVLATPTQII